MARREQHAQVTAPDEQVRASPEARAKLVEELEDAVGKEAVEQADVDVDQAISERPRPLRTAFASSRLLIVITGATAVTVGVVASLATGSWLLMAAALLVHGVVTAIVVGATMKMTTQVENPDPSAVAELEDEGVDDPEPVVNELVNQVQQDRAARSRSE